MTYFQVKAVLASGAVMLFGVQAGTADEVPAVAGERLPESGLPLRELVIELLPAVSER